MRILVVQQSAPDQPSQGEDFLAQEYPDAERITVSNLNDLAQALEQEEIDLALVDGGPSWMRPAELLRFIHDRRPGLSAILLAPERSETQAKLEQELRYSQSMIDSLLNTPSDMILMIDPQHRVINANQAFYQISGKRAEEVRGRTMFEILPPDLAARREAALQRVFETGETLRFEDRGVEAWLDITIYPICDSQGKVLHVVAYAHDLSERKILEDGLGESQKIIDGLLNAPTDLIMLLDRQCRFLRVNQTFCQRFATSPEEVLGRSLFEILPAALAQERTAIAQQAFASGEIIRFEDRGVTGWFDNSVYPILNGEGQVEYVGVVARDITDRKHLEELLRRDQRAMLAMANTPNDIFLLMDLSGTILQTNEVMARSLGQTEAELIGKRFWDQLPKPAAEFRQAVFDRVVQTGLSERVEDQGRNGSYDSRVIPVTDDQGQVVQVAILARDITERKRIEQALKESEEQYRTLVEASPDGIAFQDLDSRVLLANQQFATLFGYESPDEIYALQIRGTDLIDEQDHQIREKAMAAALQNGFMREVAFSAHRKDGTHFQLEVNGAVVHDSEGNPSGFIAICRDVTERNSVQQALVQAHEHLEHRVIERTAELQAINRQLRKEIYLRKQAEEQWQRQALHAEALAQVASRANAQLGLKAVLEAICREIIRVLPYPISTISLYREPSDDFVIEAYASQVAVAIDRVPPIPRALFVDYLSQHGPMIVIPDVHALPSGSGTMTVASPAIRTVSSIPLFYEGELIGILSVASVEEIFIPSQDETDLLQAISNQAALAITNARLIERFSDGQARLKALTERLVEVQEAEIRKVARELHDEIGQVLTSLSLNLELVTRSIEADEDKSNLQVEMELIRAQVKYLLNQVRDLSLNLLPTMLEDLGLLPALLDHFQRFTAQTGIQVNLAHHGLEARLPAQLETTAYRIIQEALTNVARYAKASRVDVRLWATSMMLGLQVEDQGVGFDLQQAESAHRSSGIAGMRERAANCGGDLEIETTPGQGTCLTVEFPYENSNQFGGTP